MNNDSLQSLLIAKTLFDRSYSLCRSENKYEATAGLILLQDAIEAFLYSALIEVANGTDLKIEKKSFDELIGLLNSKDVNVKHQHTLKLINKQRVMAKHFAQIMEPEAVFQYYKKSLESIENLVQSVFRMRLQEISIAEILMDCEAKNFLIEADRLRVQEMWFRSLIEIRKAIYLEFEHEYNVADWKNVKSTDKLTWLSMIGMRGGKSPAYTRNSSWIAKNVRSPIDYIQIDFEELRYTALEYGFSFEELQNIRRITPAVYRNSENETWHIEYSPEQMNDPENRSAVLYCLDRASLMISKKQRYLSSARFLQKSSFFTLDETAQGKLVYEKPDKQSEIVGTIDNPLDYSLVKTLTGFDGGWYELAVQIKPNFGKIIGYIAIDDAQANH